MDTARVLRPLALTVSLLLSLVGVSIVLAPPAAAGFVGVTVTIKGAGSVEAVEGGPFTCAKTNDYNDDASSSCPRHTQEAVFMAGVKFRATPADLPQGNSDWRFSHWEGCRYVYQYPDYQQCQVYSDDFNAKEFAVTAVFVDVVAPTAGIASGPVDGQRVNSTSASFGLTKGGSLANLRCRLDAGSEGDCGATATYTNLSQGPHTFRVYAIDPSGNRSITHQRSWTVDTVAPSVQITGGPLEGSRTSNNDPTFTFSSNDPGAALLCRRDGESFVNCPGGRSYTDLSDGQHTFQVFASDGLNTSAPVTRTWTIDTTPPTVEITGGPANGSRSQTSDAEFTFTSPEPGATLQCKLDAEDFASCAGSRSYSGLPDGEHTFAVRALDNLGNTSTAVTRTWTIDTAAPDTVISGGPSGLVADTTPTFTFGSPAPDVAGYECRVDAGTWAVCSAGGSHTTTPLAGGAHTFAVRAIDHDGNVDPTPAGRAFSVLAAPPNTRIAAGPSRTTKDRTPTFRFRSSPTGARFQCKVDRAPWRACGARYTTKRLTYGKHTVRVRATLAGLTDRTPAVRTFKVIRR